jgi:membrane protein YqaA with SNARE-associated domain
MLQDLALWLLVWVLAVAINVVPAFMPPTWALLTYFHIGHGMDVLPLALVGAFGSTTGRTLLALLSRAFGERFVPARWQTNITALAEALRDKPAVGVSTLLLYTLGPAPSNQLFIAAGLANAPLAPVVAVFAVTRFVSYLIWVGVATTAAASLREVVAPRFGNAVAVAAQLVGFVVLILIMQIDWTTLLKRWHIMSPDAKQGVDPSRSS